MTNGELLEKFEKLTDENKVKALAHLEQLIARQDTHPSAPGSPAKATPPAH